MTPQHTDSAVAFARVVSRCDGVSIKRLPSQGWHMWITPAGETSNVMIYGESWEECVACALAVVGQARRA